MINRRLIITPGEPAGIGPDIVLQIAQQCWDAELIVIADPDMLAQRAKLLNLKFSYDEVKLEKISQFLDPAVPSTGSGPRDDGGGHLKIIPVSVAANVVPGKLDSRNAAYVVNTLKLATQICLNFNAGLVTGPVNKAVLNQAGIAFTGHTEFLAQQSGVAKTVMLFVVEKPRLKVALATTHIPLSQVAKHISKDALRTHLRIFQHALKQQFNLPNPVIGVCGLNPHAGENGYLGREEIEIISPLLAELNQQGFHLLGPLPADTLFTPKHLKQMDAVLAMYHDQALPLVKYLGFGQAVNVTLGLPFVRTSVDHGTALDVAGTGSANANSMAKAIALAITLCSQSTATQ